jgi:rRNA-processing protein FCF1
MMFIIDSSVIIDYRAVQPLVLGSIAEHLGPVLVPEPILGEIDGMNHRDCEDLGIEVIDPEMEDYAYAASKPYAGPSGNDLVCMHIAMRLKAVCVTNDKPLREACIDSNVNVMWGLRPMIQLVKVGALPPQNASGIAKSMVDQNSWIPRSALSQFEKDLVKEARKLAQRAKAQRKPKKKQ